MNTTMDLQNFHEYTSSILHSSDNPESILLNCHTTFLMSMSKYRQNIKDYRMQWFVNSYTNYANIDATPYYEHYKKNVNDNYSGIFDPPPCFYNEMLRQEQNAANELLRDQEYDEIAQHYKELETRYAILLQSNQTENIDDEMYFEECEDEFDASSTQDDTDYQTTDDYDYAYEWEDENEFYEDDDYDF